MASRKSVVALDVGEKRIGVAVADLAVRIAIAYDTFDVDGTEIERIVELVQSEQARTLVVGYPRNQSGEATKQTEYVEMFVDRLREIDMDTDIVFQDESLTSVAAEDILKSRGVPYQKSDIDSLAASLILQDYIEVHYG